MQSIVSPTRCIIDSSFDGSGILEEGNLHFCIHSIAEKEAVQKTTACIARVNKSRPTNVSESMPIQVNESRPIQENESRPVQENESRPAQESQSRPVQVRESRPIQVRESRPI